MNKRQVIQAVIAGQRPPYVPWHFSFTQEAADKLRQHLGITQLDQALGNHLLWMGNSYGFFENVGNDRVRDLFGVIWDRSEDKDIGIVEGCVLSEPTLKDYTFPDPLCPQCFQGMDEQIASQGDRYRVFALGFSLYERAWTLRGMENLMIDMIENPDFVDQLLDAIADYNIAQVRKALQYDIDAVYFGDDWGQQQGLQMGKAHWDRFILPRLQRMYGTVRSAGKSVFIHSCGDVDELFPDLIRAGVNCFNPFQPEVMDVLSLMKQYRGKLTFHGGLSTQQTLPYGSVEQVRQESQRLLEAGREGNYIFSPAHAVEGDVPVENMIAFIELAQQQLL